MIIYCPLCGNHHAASQPCDVIIPTSDANDLDDVVRELGIEASETTPAEAVRELKAESDRLHAELADRERRLEVITRALETSCANVTNRDARIAELADLVTIHQHSCKLAIARAERAEADRAKADETVANAMRLLHEEVDRAEKASENGCLRAELSQTKRDLKDWQDSSEAYRHDAEKAEAHIKELNNKWADDVLRVDRAEAERDAMREARWWMSWDSAPKDGRWIVAVCNDMVSLLRVSWGNNREGHLAWCSNTSSYGDGDGLFAGWIDCPTKVFGARAALSPSPDGREG